MSVLERTHSFVLTDRVNVKTILTATHLHVVPLLSQSPIVPQAETTSGFDAGFRVPGVVSMVMSVKVDGVDGQRISWDNAFSNSDSEAFQGLAWDARNAVSAQCGSLTVCCTVGLCECVCGEGGSLG